MDAKHDSPFGAHSMNNLLMNVMISIHQECNKEGFGYRFTFTRRIVEFIRSHRSTNHRKFAIRYLTAVIVSKAFTVKGTLTKLK